MSNSSNDNFSLSEAYAKRECLSPEKRHQAETLMAVIVGTKAPFDAVMKLAPLKGELVNIPDKDDRGLEITKDLNLAVNHIVNAKNISTKLLEQILRGES